MESSAARGGASARGRALAIGVLLVACVVAALAVWGPGGAAVTEPDASAELPVDAESFDAARVDAEVNPEAIATAVVVFSRTDGALSDSDGRAVDAIIGRLVQEVPAEAREEPQRSSDGQAVLVRLPLSLDSGDPASFVEDLRAASTQDLPDGVAAEVTGGVAVTEDLTAATTGSPSYVVLLLAVLVGLASLTWVLGGRPVAVVLVVVVLAAAEQTTRWWVALGTQALPFVVDTSTAPLTAALVVGLGAMQSLHFLRGSGSDRGQLACATVAGAALAPLVLAESPATRAVAASGLIGVVTVTVFTCTVLPAAARLAPALAGPRTGRALADGPSVPPSGPGGRSRSALVVGAVLVLTLLAATPLLAARLGPSQAERFEEVPEAIAGQRTLAEHFPAGVADPTIVTVPEDSADAVGRAVAGVPGVADVASAGSAGQMAVLDVVLDRDPASPGAREVVEDLRATARDVEPDALVGGIDAEALDAGDAAVRDLALLAPAVLVLVAAVVVAWAGRPVRALASWAAMPLAWLAGLGLGWGALWASGRAAFELRVPLVSLVLLCAVTAATTLLAARGDRPWAGPGRVGLALAVVGALTALPASTPAQVGLVTALAVLVHGALTTLVPRRPTAGDAIRPTDTAALGA